MAHSMIFRDRQGKVLKEKERNIIIRQRENELKKKDIYHAIMRSVFIEDF